MLVDIDRHAALDDLRHLINRLFAGEIIGGFLIDNVQKAVIICGDVLDGVDERIDLVGLFLRDGIEVDRYVRPPCSCHQRKQALCCLARQ